MPDKSTKKNTHSTKVAPAEKTVKVEKIVKTVEPAEVADAMPPLNTDLLASYRDSHYRLLLLLGLMLAFLLSCFPISDPDIFFSLQVGKMVTSGTFPWGEDPFCFAQGDHAPWIHSGWLGDTVIYYLYQAGGGPLLVFVRAILVVFLFSLLMKLGQERSPKLGTVVTIILAIVTVSQRLYFRTELFSFVLLGVTFWALASNPKCGCRLTRLHNLTAGRWYWLLPVLFLLWANLDGWFFLGLFVVIVWCLGSWLKPSALTRPQLQALTITTVLSIVASCCSPFHVKALTEIPVRLQPPTATELHARYEEQKLINPKQRYSEQQRLFESPWSSEFFVTQRSDVLASQAGQAPLLPLCYPSGLSLSEWAYYPLCLLVLLSVIAAVKNPSWGTFALLLAFMILGCMQSRFVGFFAIGGAALAVIHFQSGPPRVPSLGRFSIFGGQMLCLIIGVFTQVLCLLHLIPTPDFSPSSVGHVHPRGSMGFAFRSDRAIEEACQELGRWNDTKQIAGKPFHFDWTDVVAYDVWFNPGGRHFFDRRYEVHDATVAKDFIAASDAILGVALEPLKEDRSNLPRVYERQEKWKEVFAKYDISYLIVKKRGQQQREMLVRGLLLERDKNNQLIWKPLQLHNGQVYALAWTGSKHWDTLKKFEFQPGDSFFRRKNQFAEVRSPLSDKPSLGKYLRGDAVRRPASLDEAAWHLFYPNIDGSAHTAMRHSEFELNTLPITLAVRFASPLNTLPLIPPLFGPKQGSISSTMMGLESVRRAIAELAPEATPQQRLDAWLQYLQTLTQLIEYEQMFTPATIGYHDPLRLFVTRQTAFAALDAGFGPALPINLQLARMYINAGAFDAALEHYTFVRAVIEKQKPEHLEAMIKQFDSDCQKQYGFVPPELQKEVTRLTESWQREVARAGWQPTEADPGKDVINRAGLAVRLGLPRKALDELLASGVKSPEVSMMACQIYSVLGQHDIVLEEFIDKSPAIRTALGPIEFHFRSSLGNWCLGRPDRAAEHRLAIAELMDQAARHSILDAGMRSLFGTNTQPIGNVLTGTMLGQQAAGESFGIADQQIAAGLLYLEAGKPQRAAELFKQALHNVEPVSPWRPLLERYYHQITGESLPR